MNKPVRKFSSEEINEKFKKEIDEYFSNDARKLHKLVDKVLKNLKFHDIDVEDYYSLSHEIFYNSLQYYDKAQPFKGFIYSCLYKKFCTDMTAKKRSKRCTKIKVKKTDSDGNIIIETKILQDERLDRPIKDGECLTLRESIASDKSIESEIYGEKEEGYSQEMIAYLSRLSDLQKEVLRLISIGFMPSEILDELHINKKIYDDCYNAIHSYRNISLLMQ